MLAARPTLSLCVLTNGDPARATAFLRVWRPHVDEIVVAVDQGAHPDTPSACRELADRVVIVPTIGYVERYLGWLLAQCSGDWVIRIDDDELPSTALLEMLPELLGSGNHTHYWLPCRWVYPTPERYLACRPWLEDAHARLVRNLPGLWRSSGRLHSEVVVLGASRIVEAPFLHLTTLIDSLADRRAKVRRYTRADPTEQTVGRGTTGAYYLPEESEDVVTAPLPASDADRVRAFVQSVARRPIPASGSDLPLVPDVDLRALDSWSDEVLGLPGRWGAQVRWPHPLSQLVAGSLTHVQVEVRNTGEDVWPGGPSAWPLVRLGHRWEHSDGTLLDRPTPRTYFTERVFPGAMTSLWVGITAPDVAGSYRLRIEVVEEFVRWYESPATHVVEVVAGDPEDSAAPLTSAPRTSAPRTSAPKRVIRPLAERFRAPLSRQLQRAGQRIDTRPAPRSQQFGDDLRLLHDLLAATPFGPRYWVWGGLLLGWAREGALLEHDLFDADFGFLESDSDLFRSAAVVLMANGFRPLFRFLNNEGRPTEYSFSRHDAKFEFFVATPRANGLDYYVYGGDDGRGLPPMQAISAVPKQPLDDFSFLGRWWRKHTDHERELTAMYGDWRTPDPDWWYLADPSIHTREPWRQRDYRWTGDFDRPATELVE